MADNKTKQGSGDRARVAGGQDHEVEHFAKKHGNSSDEAKRLFKENGNDRAKLDAASSKAK